MRHMHKMSSPSASRPQQGPPFESARGILRKREEASPIATGSTELDRLTGSLMPGLFYLLYGDDDTGVPDVMLHRLLVEAVAQGGRAVYVVCGNYRRSRTVAWSTTSVMSRTSRSIFCLLALAFMVRMHCWQEVTTVSAPVP